MAKSSTDTPMMRQYLEAKAAHPDAVLLMRMGDFYEAFMGDAEELARHAGVALTCRNKDADDPIAMAGVPHHSLGTYLPRLLAAGKRVAIMDQLEDPKTAKGLVKRGLTRLITAGTLIDESALDVSAANHLVALTALDAAGGDVIGIAALDTSTGRFTVESADNTQHLALALARLAPAELLLPDDLRRRDDTTARLASLCAPVPVPPVAGLAAYAWKPTDARRWLGERLGVASLEGFGISAGDDHLASAAAAALRYADSAANPGGTGKTLGHVRRLRRLHHDDHLVIDATCRRNLELLRNSRDQGVAGSLFGAINRTRSAAGARLLAEWLSHPLTALSAISARHDAVAFLVADDRRRDEVRAALAQVYDLERLLARIATGRAHGRDLVHLATTVQTAGVLATALGNDAATPELLMLAHEHLHPATELVHEIRRTLVDDPPLTIGEGGLMRDGVDADLDHLRGIRRDADAWLAQYQAREAAACGLKQIKVGYNKVFGYYIELSRARGDQVPAHFVRKQTLVGAERYITPELKEFEDQALGAEEKINALELAHFTRLRERAEQALDEVQACAHALALIDVFASLAEVARKQGWCRPLVDDSLTLDLCDSRHPVVEDVLGRGRFVANDCTLDAGAASYELRATSPSRELTTPPVDNKNAQPSEDELAARSSKLEAPPAKLAVITGPNMAGKSTYIRQIALAVILAQAGSFVPAASARIGVVDRVFTRVGAGDELARGQSTFMVEMAETAAILNHATRRSLVVLDEVGRGTSTYDGVSLAWAITEHLHDRIGCRALFATHYHELVDLAVDRPGVCNLTVSVAEQDDTVVFLHRIVAGAATRSYGIHVARLAGVPEPVIARARQVLATLEQLDVDLAERERPGARQGATPAVQLTLFSAAPHPLLAQLAALDLDALSPRQAWELLGRWQEQARRG
jgi:DNA mismatch repair protein MutS